MKALTLHQPWATAVALGIKTVETRSWRTGYRGPLAIHAGAKVPPYNDHGVPVSLVPRPDGLVGHFGGIAHPLPLGAIVATCRLVDVVPMVNIREPMTAAAIAAVEALSVSVEWRNGWPVHAMQVEHRGIEVVCVGDGWTLSGPWGDFTPGRWAWLLDDVKPTTERCPACWGEKCFPGARYSDGLVEYIDPAVACHVCRGEYRPNFTGPLGHCDPVPAKGARGLWTWTP